MQVNSVSSNNVSLLPVTGRERAMPERFERAASTNSHWHFEWSDHSASYHLSEEEAKELKPLTNDEFDAMAFKKVNGKLNEREEAVFLWERRRRGIMQAECQMHVLLRLERAYSFQYTPRGKDILFDIALIFQHEYNALTNYSEGILTQDDISMMLSQLEERFNSVMDLVGRGWLGYNAQANSDRIIYRPNRDPVDLVCPDRYGNVIGYGQLMMRYIKAGNSVADRSAFFAYLESNRAEMGITQSLRQTFPVRPEDLEPEEDELILPDSDLERLKRHVESLSERMTYAELIQKFMRPSDLSVDESLLFDSLNYNYEC